ncbi:5662_t:CDS:1, partial [Funneliformis mosseae]
INEMVEFVVYDHYYYDYSCKRLDPIILLRAGSTPVHVNAFLKRSSKFE